MPEFRVTYRQLEIFLAVAEEKGVTAAAHRLSVSQAAISRQMLALERKLGCVLFERKRGSPSSLTERGQLLLQQAPELLTKISDVASRWDRPVPYSKRVRVASGDIIQGLIFQPKMIDFYRLHPDIQVELIELPPVAESVAKMSKLQIDLAYFTLSQSVQIASGEFLSMLDHGLFISPQHPIAAEWKPDSSVSLPLLLPLSGSTAESCILKVLQSAGIANYHVVAHVQRADTMIQLALEGVGACWAMSHFVEEHIEQHRLRDLNVGLGKLCRYRFRRPAMDRAEHVDVVDQFLTSLIVRSSSANAAVS
jgi:DNA-binding transcriptional LysR family regulator